LAFQIDLTFIQNGHCGFFIHIKTLQLFVVVNIDQAGFPFIFCSPDKIIGARLNERFLFTQKGIQEHQNFKFLNWCNSAIFAA